MYKHEGMFSYWKGILPPILAETPKRATKFVCFEQYKRLFMFGSDKATPLVNVYNFESEDILLLLKIINNFLLFRFRLIR